MKILPLTYLGSVEYFAHLLDGECIIDIGEHFIKRSERNRTRIMTANGVLPLTVHVRNANRPRTPVRDIRIDYSKRWQHQHRIAVISAYRSSPYFDHYAPHLLPLFERRFDFLTDLNFAFTERLLDLSHIERRYEVSETYVEPADGLLDLRAKGGESNFCCPPYYQLFSDRFDFAPNLSFLDLLFAEGPGAVNILRRCRR